MADSPVHERRELVRNLYIPDSDLELFSFAEANDIAPHVSHALRDTLGDHTPPHWIEAHESTERRNRSYLGELDRVASRLAESDIRLVALKNAGIARGIHPCPGCSPMGDLDALVDRSRFREAHEILLACGFTPEFRSPLESGFDLDAAERGGGSEYFTILPGGEKLWFELQWRPVSGRWIRPGQEPGGSALLERSVEIPGTPVRLLSPLDNLLQVALHTAKHTYVRPPGLRLHTDVDRIVRRQSIDWGLFVARAGELRVRTAVYFSLSIPRQFLGTPVPSEVLAELAPSPARRRGIERRLSKAGLLFPGEKKFSNGAYILFVSLLYDSLADLLRSAFPESRWMRQQYGFRSRWAVPAYHVKRLVGLAWRRTL